MDLNKDLGLESLEQDDLDSESTGTEAPDHIKINQNNPDHNQTLKFQNQFFLIELSGASRLELIDLFYRVLGHPQIETSQSMALQLAPKNLELQLKDKPEESKKETKQAGTYCG